MVTMTHERILVVDDERDILELVEYNLQKEGFTVTCVASGEEAVAAARARQPDLIVLDLMLPGVDGLEVCRRLRAETATRHIPIVMLTARGGEADIVAGLELGAADYVTKPFSPRVLTARLRAVLRRDKEADHEAVLRVGPLEDSTLIARKVLRYRHQLVASSEYLKNNKAPKKPSDLLNHRLLAFSFWNQQCTWTFDSGKKQETIKFSPNIAMNDYAGLANALVSGAGIGDLPPIVLPGLIKKGVLVEVMPKWRFHAIDILVVHLGNRHIPRPVRLFKEFAVQMAPTLFDDLPD